MADEIGPYVALLETTLGPAWTVYTDMVPAGSIPARYVLVTTSAGEWSSINPSGVADYVTPSLTVTYVSVGPDPARIAREVKAVQRRGDAALAAYRPSVGRATWLPEHATSSRPVRDDSLPEPVVFATSQYLLRYQP